MLNIGDPAPQFSAVDVINGNTYKLSDYAGRIVLLIFSGPSWCGPCQFEAPVLQELWQVFSKVICAPQTQFLMVSCFDMETPQAFKTAVQNFGITFPALLNPNQKINTLYEVFAVPTLFVIGKDQKICNIYQGASPPADTLYDEIYSSLIGCGSCDKRLTADLSRWAAVIRILFGGTQDGGGLGLTPGGVPIPIDPSNPFFRMSPEKKDVLMNLAISEMTKSLKDSKTAGEIELAALKSAEASMRTLVSKASQKPLGLKSTFSVKPTK